MSLFKARDWWRVDTGTGQLYDKGSLVVSCLTGDPGLPESHMQLVVGSLSGLLQIFQPTNQDGSEARPEDLLLEQQLENPILQVGSGQLLNKEQGRQLAILHPRKLSVYQLSRRQGSRSQGDSYELSLSYQHSLVRSAHSFVVGPFGGMRGKDYIALLSLDGTLSIFEQESHSFSRFLPGFLLPGPLAFVERTDSFVVTTSDFGLQSFKYQGLAIATDDRQESQETSSGKRVAPDWNLGLGQPLLDLQVMQSTDMDEPSVLVALNRQGLSAVLDTGTLLWSKRLEFSPLCLLATPSLVFDSRIVSLVTSDSDTLLFYDNTTLKWAAQLPGKPVALQRGRFWDSSQSAIRDGLLVSLSEEGTLTVSYLGTDPSLHAAAPPDSREVNYEETDRELARLSAKIRQSQKEGAGRDVKTGQPPLKMEVTVAHQLEVCSFPSRVLTIEQAVPMVAVAVKLHSPSPLTRVRVSLQTSPPLAVGQPSHTVNSLTDTQAIRTHVYLASPHPVSSLELSVVCTFVTTDGVPHSLHQTVNLPLSLVIKPCPPVKDADFKVTVSTNKPAVSLLELFPEFVLDSSMTNAAGFQLYGGAVITVLSSKTSQRYRLQSENLAAIWVITNHVLRRLKLRFPADLECGYSSSLPLQEFYMEIDGHFTKRRQEKHMMEVLAQRTAQFRAIQRRLLTRFKDKTPTPLTNLDMLLEGTHRQVLQSAEAVETHHREVERGATELSCIVRLLLLLARLSVGMAEEDAAKLEAALTPLIHTGQEQGWEETTDAALTFLLRTSLAKPGRENQGATPITLEPVKETSRIKKHVSSVVDRITKGGKLEDLNLVPDSSPFIDSFDRGDADDPDVGMGLEVDSMEVVGRALAVATPMGTRFGESGERIRSARMRTARSARSRPVSASSSLAGEMGDVPPDGPVDIDALEDDLLTTPPTRAPKLGDIKSEKGIESPLEIFPAIGPANDQDEDIW